MKIKHEEILRKSIKRDIKSIIELLLCLFFLILGGFLMFYWYGWKMFITMFPFFAASHIFSVNESIDRFKKSIRGKF